MEHKAIAITGMSCIFPGAYDLDAYWKNILAGRCAIGPVPRERDTVDALEGTRYSEPPLSANGGFLPAEIPFSPLLYGVIPSICEDSDPEQLLILQLADRALRDSGIDPQKEDLTNSEIILGRGGYLGNFLRQGFQYVDILPQVVNVVKQLVPGLSHSKLANIRKELKSCFAHLRTDRASLGIPNITTGRVANRFNMMGANYTIDAACASALIATENAVMSLRQQRCERVITGGSFLANNPSFWWLFVHLEAMSSSGMIKPFSKFADGLLAGEGIGLLVLERLEDAVKAGRRIYAVIRGVGTASDGRGAGVLAPRKEGQIECLRRAYREAGIDPNTVELLEGHGTATKIGDKTELDAINEFFGLREDDVPTRALGSVKSMIGHTMPASGAASLIKIALSLYHKILPPTLCDDDPNEGFAKSKFYLNTATRPWVHPPTAKRRAGINAFGFGGINGHAILEEFDESGLAIDDLVMDWPVELFLLSADSIEALKAAIKALIDQQAEFRSRNRLFALLSRDVCKSGDKFSDYRLAVIAPDYDALAERLAAALTHLEQTGGQASSQMEGIHFEAKPLKKSGKIAFVFPGNAFPGLGDDYTHHLGELCVFLPFFRYGFDLLDRDKILADKSYRYSTIMFSPTKIDHESLVRLKKELRVLDNSASGVFAANALGYDLMRRLNVSPDMITGTSLGEWSAVVCAGMVKMEQLREMNARAETDAVNEIKGAIGLSRCTVEALQPYIDEFNRGEEVAVTCSMDLSPQMTVFAGPRDRVECFCNVLNEAGIWAKYLNLFPIHSPMCQPIAEHIYNCLEGLEVVAPAVPAFSAATVAPFPTDPEQLRRLLADNAVLPMQMRRLFLKLYDEGARIFVQLGGGGKIAGPIEETLEGKDHAIVSLDVSNIHPIHQLQQLVAVLYAHHTPISTDALFLHRNGYLDRSIEKKDKRADFVVRLKMALPNFEIKDPGLKIDINENPAVAPAAPAPEPPVHPRPQPEPRPVESAAIQPESEWEEVMAEQLNAMTRLYAMQKADEMNDMAHFINMLSCQAQLIMSGSGGRPAARMTPAGPQPAAATFKPAVERPPATQRLQPLPFAGTIIEHVAHQKLVMKRKLSLASDLFLKDHAFIPCPDNIKAPEEKLPTLPMAVALEIMAETAQALVPGKKVCGLMNISNKRWIGLTESGPQKDLMMTANVSGNTADGQIAVSCTIAVEGEANEACLTGTVLLADQYNAATGPLPIQQEPRATQMFENIDPKLLYRPGGLYHGKIFQGLEAVLQTTDCGVQARLRVPPHDGFFRDHHGADMILPAQTIDVASQLICCYDLGVGTKNNWVAPVSIERIWLYDTAPSPGDQVKAKMIIRDNNAHMVRFDVVLASGNGIFMIIAGWRDWRMKWSERLLAAWQNPSETLLARRRKNNAPFTANDYAFYGVTSSDIFGMDPDWLARFYLNTSEYKEWCQSPKGQQKELLTQYIAVKDATRGLLQQRKIYLYPSQIIAKQSGAGQFTIRMKDNTAFDFTPLSVITARQNGETVALAVPVPIEDFSDIKIDLFSEMQR